MKTLVPILDDIAFKASLAPHAPCTVNSWSKPMTMEDLGVRPRQFMTNEELFALFAKKIAP